MAAVCTRVYIFLINRAQTQTLNNIFSGFHFECPAVCWATKQLQIVFIYIAHTLVHGFIYLMLPHIHIFPWLLGSSIPHPSPLITFVVVVVAFSIFRLQIGKVQTHTHTACMCVRWIGKWGLVVSRREPEMVTSTWPDSKPRNRSETGGLTDTGAWVQKLLINADLQSCWPMHSGKGVILDASFLKKIYRI